MAVRSNRLRNTGLILLLLCLIWMDACLYFRIQNLDDNERENDHSDARRSDGKSDTGQNKTIHHKLPFMDKFSEIAFQGMSIKLMMTDPVDNYLMGPLSEAFAQMIDFKHNLLFVSANMVSYAGVVTALIAAKLVTYDSSTLHKLSFVMFQMRTWLDDLDGVVARSRMGIHKHVSLSKTSGYVVDGVCDAIGFVAYVFGCFIFMRRSLVRQHRRQRRQHQRLLSSPSTTTLLKTANDVSERFNLQSITEIKSGGESATATTRYVPLDQRSADDHLNYDCELDMAPSACELSDNEDNDAESNEDSVISSDEDEEIILHDSLNLGNKDPQKLRKGMSTDQHATIASRLDQSGEQRIKVPRMRKRARNNHQGHTSISRSTRFFLNRVTRRLARAKHARHTLIFYRYIKEKIKHNINNRRTVLLILCFLLQLAMCSMFWNRYILIYRDLLESTSTSVEQSRAKRKILKSNIMYILIWFWRLTNGHTFMQMLVGAVFLGKLWQFLNFIKFIGFVEIITLATITELHVIDVKNYIADM